MNIPQSLSVQIGERTFTSVPDLAKYYSSSDFEQKYTYYGRDLGCVCTRTTCSFRLWSPAALKVRLRLYRAGSWEDPDGTRYEEFDMLDGGHGTFRLSLSGDYHGRFYTYLVDIGGRWTETADPYAKAAGVNGRRSMAVDLSRTDPEGWQEDPYSWRGTPQQAIVWEMHIRDFSFNRHSGMKNKGQYLAFTERGTVVDEKQEYPTGLDYLCQLGITHVQLLPVADFATVDETHLDEEQYNWGYDPLNYFVPEGSYTSNPFDGAVRIREFKQMVLSMHQAGIGVIMDIVLNHTYFTEKSWLNLTMPYYYYRTDAEGRFCNGSGCGNETASERSMCRLLMLDVVRYWAVEYHIDGFRFDLMGVHDTDTMNEIRAELDLITNKDVLLYGEPWSAAPIHLPQRPHHPLFTASKENLDRLDSRILAFDDETRDLIKGNTFCAGSRGFITQSGYVEEPLSKCIAGEGSFGIRGIKYASCHDNATLWDKLTEVISRDGSGFDQPELVRVAVNKLSAAIVFTSQGMSFVQGGEEFGRSKHGISNSYHSPTAENALHWKRTIHFAEMVAYYKGLIQIRRSFSPFTDSTGWSRSHIRFFQKENQVIAYVLAGKIPGEPADMVVILNAGDDSQSVTLTQEGEKLPTSWQILANQTYAGLKSLGKVEGLTFSVFPRSALILASEKKVLP